MISGKMIQIIETNASEKKGKDTARNKKIPMGIFACLAGVLIVLAMMEVVVAEQAATPTPTPTPAKFDITKPQTWGSAKSYEGGSSDFKTLAEFTDFKTKFSTITDVNVRKAFYDAMMKYSSWENFYTILGKLDNQYIKELWDYVPTTSKLGTAASPQDKIKLVWSALISTDAGTGKAGKPEYAKKLLEALDKEPDKAKKEKLFADIWNALDEDLKAKTIGVFNDPVFKDKPDGQKLREAFLKAVWTDELKKYNGKIAGIDTVFLGTLKLAYVAGQGDKPGYVRIEGGPGLKPTIWTTSVKVSSDGKFVDIDYAVQGKSSPDKKRTVSLSTKLDGAYIDDDADGGFYIGGNKVASLLYGEGGKITVTKPSAGGEPVFTMEGAKTWIRAYTGDANKPIAFIRNDPRNTGDKGSVTVASGLINFVSSDGANYGRTGISYADPSAYVTNTVNGKTAYEKQATAQPLLYMSYKGSLAVGSVAQAQAQAGSSFGIDLDTMQAYAKGMNDPAGALVFPIKGAISNFITDQANPSKNVFIVRDRITNPAIPGGPPQLLIAINGVAVSAQRQPNQVPDQGLQITDEGVPKGCCPPKGPPQEEQTPGQGQVQPPVGPGSGDVQIGGVTPGGGIIDAGSGVPPVSGDAGGTISIQTPLQTTSGGFLAGPNVYALVHSVGGLEYVIGPTPTGDVYVDANMRHLGLLPAQTGGAVPPTGGFDPGSLGGTPIQGLIGAGNIQGLGQGPGQIPNVPGSTYVGPPIPGGSTTFPPIPPQPGQPIQPPSFTLPGIILPPPPAVPGVGSSGSTIPGTSSGAPAPAPPTMTPPAGAGATQQINLEHFSYVTKPNAFNLGSKTIKLSNGQNVQFVSSRVGLYSGARTVFVKTSQNKEYRWCNSCGGGSWQLIR